MEKQKSIKHLVMRLLTALLIIPLMSCASIIETRPDPVTETKMPKIKIGYCPTMMPLIENMVENAKNLIPVHYDNAAMAMQALKAGDVHAVLIGRIVWEHEILDNLQLVRLEDNLTLIAARPGWILYDDLVQLTLMTSEEETQVRDLLPMGTSIAYYQDVDQMISEMDSSRAILLRWSQVLPSYNLLIPLDARGNKVPEFRSPHLYYLNLEEAIVTALIDVLSADH